MKEEDTGEPREGMDAYTDPPSSVINALLNNCQEVAKEHVAKIQQQVLQIAQDKLSELSDEGGERDVQFLESMRSVLQEKDSIAPQLQKALISRFQKFTHPDIVQHLDEQEVELAQSELSLVNEQQLEESLAIDHLIAKVHDCFHDELLALEHRFDYLLPQAAVTSDTIPLGPENLCYAFQDVYQHLDLDVKTKLYLYKLIDRVIMDELKSFYSALNRLLVSRGIMPKLEIKRRKNRVDRNSGAARQPEGAASGTHEAGEDATPIPAQMFKAFQYLLSSQATSSAAAEENRPPGSPAPSRQRQQEEHAPGGDGGGQDATPIAAQMFNAFQSLLNSPLDEPTDVEDHGDVGMLSTSLSATPELVDTLSSLQSNQPAQADGSDHRGGVLNLKQQVAQRLGQQAVGEQPAGINKIDDETIDVISMIFDYILDDNSLSDFIKALIARLQIPILKVAIIDREFFSSRSHPARQLLNELAYAGVGWMDESEAAKDRLYEKMEAIVSRVLHEFESDITIFVELLTEFRAFIEEEKHNFIAAQEKVRQQNLQREQCKKQVAALLMRKLKGRTVPADVKEFLMTSWHQVITQISLEDGLDNDEGKKALQAVDDLIWSLSADSIRDRRRKLTVVLPLMLATLCEGLREIGRQEEEIEAVVEMLGQHHLRILKEAAENKPAPVTEAEEDKTAKEEQNEDDIDQLIRRMNADIEELPELDGEDIDITADFMSTAATTGQGSFEKLMAEMGFQQETDSGPRVDDQYTALVRELDLGTWVELEDSGRKIRAKLAWKGDEFTNYSFMNRQYKVVAERPLYALAEEFRQGRASLIEDVALFDRAMDGVISGIMKFTR